MSTLETKGQFDPRTETRVPTKQTNKKGGGGVPSKHRHTYKRIVKTDVEVTTLRPITIYDDN